MSAVWDSIAEELLHLYPRGRRLVAVAGADAERSRTAADGLATALTAAGQTVERAHTADGEEAALRTDVVGPFRATDSDAVLLVSGPGAIVSPSARGMWNYVLWQLAGDEAPHTAANALVDVTDPAHPTRRFADYCAVPSSFET